MSGGKGTMGFLAGVGVILLALVGGGLWLYGNEPVGPVGGSDDSGSSTGQQPGPDEPTDPQPVLTAPRDYEDLPEPLRPDRVGAEILHLYYPEGRTGLVKLSGLAEGTASNRRWGFQGHYNLKATSSQSMRWTVLRNDGERVTFRVQIPVSATLLWAAQREYSIHPPQAPLLLAVLHECLPGPAPRTVWELIQMADPDLRRTATALKKFLERQEIVANEVAQLGLKVRRAGEAIQGVTTQVTYQDGMGIVSRQGLEVADGNSLSQDQIDRIDMMLRQAHPVLVAYFLYPLQAPPGGEARQTDVGRVWEVEAKHLGGLFSAYLERHATGHLTVRRRRADDGRIALEILDGEVRYQRVDADVVDATLSVDSGTTLYLRPLEGGGHGIDHGEVTAEATLHRESLDHWLVEERFQADPRLNLRIHGEPEPTD